MIASGGSGAARALASLVLAAALLAPITARGGDASPTLTAIRTDQAPAIDGRLDDPSWLEVSPETSFIQSFPDEGKPPTERTELRVLYDNNAIYIAVRCFDTHPREILARLTRRDRDIDADKITVGISSKNDKASAYHFQVNAAGAQVDGIRFNDTEYSTDWDGRWYSATSRDDQGWIAELKIPLVTLRYSGGVSSFGFQVRRHLGRRQEINEWAYVPRTAKGEVSYYGTIDGITGLNAKRLLEILAYDSRRITFRTGQGLFDGHDTGGNIGADLKLGITSALTLDATINPDFGTVEADSAVLNLSTLETFFPEKRPFFLEGADLFATPFKLFYSRRVGAAPPAPTLAGAAELAEPVPEGRIWGALKLTGLLADRLSIAVLGAVTSRADATVARVSGDPTEELLVEPLSSFGVLRLRREFGTNSSLGILATAVNRLEPANAATPQPADLCPVPYSTTFRTLDAPPPRDGRCTNDAYTAGLDTVLRTSDGEWGISAQVIGSVVRNGPTRIVPDGTELGPGSAGVGVISEAGKYGGENWLYKIGYSGASPELQINDAGYLDQANFHNLYSSLTWRTTRPTKRFLSASVDLFFQYKTDWELKDTLYTDPHVKTILQLPSFWTISAELSPYFPKWVEHRETQDGARAQRDAGYYYAFDVKSDPQRRLVLGLSGNMLKVYGGVTALFGSATLSLRPVPALEIDIIPTVNWAYNSPRWVHTEANLDDSRTYYFGILDAKSFDVTLRGTYTFTRNLSLQAFVQPFVVGGHYSRATSVTASGPKPFLSLDSFVDATLPAGVNPDFREGAINLNLFLRWEFLPLSVFWVVFTHNQTQTSYDPMEGPARIRFGSFAGGPTTDTFLLKLSYLWF